MKKLIFSLYAISILLTSCTENDNETVAQQKQPVVGEITGDFATSTSTSFAFGNYTLKGIVKIKAGSTLTFDAGSTITANVGDGVDALVVENGGKLIINGTANEPVVFTEASKTPGSWGGIIMYGDAPIVGAAGVTSATSEDGLAISYGGTNPAHNGGSLKYVRVEYAGKKITDGTSEMNAFSFYSVGSGTVLENLVAYSGADDGFEFYGGTVSAKDIISYGNYDDSFDWQDGWKGQNNSNWYAIQVGTGNYGIEAESKSVNNTFWPVVKNITLKRLANTLTENSSAEYDAFQFKKQGNGDFDNILIEGYTTNANAVVIRIQETATNTDQVNASKIKLTNIKVVGSTPLTGAGASTFNVSFPANQLTTSNSATGATISTGKWSTVGNLNLLQ